MSFAFAYVYVNVIMYMWFKCIIKHMRYLSNGIENFEKSTNAVGLLLMYLI